MDRFTITRVPGEAGTGPNFELKAVDRDDFEIIWLGLLRRGDALIRQGVDRKDAYALADRFGPTALAANPAGLELDGIALRRVAEDLRSTGMDIQAGGQVDRLPLAIDVIEFSLEINRTLALNGLALSSASAQA